MADGKIELGVKITGDRSLLKLQQNLAKLVGSMNVLKSSAKVANSATKGLVQTFDITNKAGQRVVTVFEEIDGAMIKTRETITSSVDALEKLKRAQEASAKAARDAAKVGRRQAEGRTFAAQQAFPVRQQAATGAATVAEVQKFESALKKVNQLRVKNNITLKEFESIQKRVATGTSVFTGRNKDLADALRKLDMAFKNVGASARKANETIEGDPRAAQRVEQRAGAIAGRFLPSAAQTAGASTQNIKALSSAFNQLQKAVKDTGASFAQVKRVQKALNAGQVNFTGNVKKVATALISARAATEKFTKSQKVTGKEGTRAGKSVLLSWTSVARLFAVQQIHKVISLITVAMRESIATSTNFAVSLSEIQTIAGENTFTMRSWGDEIRRVAILTNRDLGDTAEAVYQTLSNQIAKSGEAIEFVRKAAIFSRVGVSSLSDAVNLLSSSLNAFDQDASEVQETMEVLFKTVELGRVRISELANSFGRVAILAKQVGLSQQELGAAIATITIQGVPAAEAQTLIRNVLLKLIKPTDKMKKLFRDLGVASGDAAVKTLGFDGVLQAIARTTGGSTVEIAGLTGRVRAIVGTLALAKNGAEDFSEALRKITFEASDTFAAGAKITEENIGFQFKKIGNEIKILFSQEIGDTIVKAIVDINKALKGLGGVAGVVISALKPFSNFLKALADPELTGSVESFTAKVTTGALAVGALALATTPAILSLRLLATAHAAAAAAATSNALAQKGAAAAITAARFAALASALGIAVVVGQIAGTIIEAFTKASDEAFKQAQDKELEFLRGATKAFKDAIDKRTKILKFGLKERLKLRLQAIADDIKILNSFQERVKNQLKKINASLKESAGEFTKSLSANLKALNSFIDRTKRNIESVRQKIASIEFKREQAEIDIKLKVLSPREQVAFLVETIENINKKIKGFDLEKIKVTAQAEGASLEESIKQRTQLKLIDKLRAIAIKRVDKLLERLRQIRPMEAATGDAKKRIEKDIAALKNRIAVIDAKTVKRNADIEDRIVKKKFKAAKLLQAQNRVEGDKKEKLVGRLQEAETKLSGSKGVTAKAAKAIRTVEEQILQIAKDKLKLELDLQKALDKRKSAQIKINKELQKDITFALTVKPFIKGELIPDFDAVRKDLIDTAERIRINISKGFTDPIAGAKILAKIQEKVAKFGEARAFKAKKLKIEEGKAEEKIKNIREKQLNLQAKIFGKQGASFIKTLDFNKKLIKDFNDSIQNFELIREKFGIDLKPKDLKIVQDLFDVTINLEVELGKLSDPNKTKKEVEQIFKDLKFLVGKINLDKPFEKLTKIDFKDEFFINLRALIAAPRELENSFLGITEQARKFAELSGLSTKEIEKQVALAKQREKQTELKKTPGFISKELAKELQKEQQGLNKITGSLTELKKQRSKAEQDAFAALEKEQKIEKQLEKNIQKVTAAQEKGSEKMQSFQQDLNKEKAITEELEKRKGKLSQEENERLKKGKDLQDKITEAINKTSKEDEKNVKKKLSFEKKLQQSKERTKLIIKGADIEQKVRDRAGIKRIKVLKKEVESRQRQIDREKPGTVGEAAFKILRDKLKKEIEKIELGLSKEAIKKLQSKALIDSNVKVIASDVKVIASNDRLTAALDKFTKAITATPRAEKFPFVQAQQQDKNVVQLVAFEDKKSFTLEPVKTEEPIGLKDFFNREAKEFFKKLPNAIEAGFKRVDVVFGRPPQEGAGMSVFDAVQEARGKIDPFSKLTPPEQLKFIQKAENEAKEKVRQVAEAKRAKTLAEGAKKFNRIFGTFEGLDKEQQRLREFFLKKGKRGLADLQGTDRSPKFQKFLTEQGERGRLVDRKRDAERKAQRDSIRERKIESRFKFLLENPDILKEGRERFIKDRLQDTLKTFDGLTSIFEAIGGVANIFKSVINPMDVNPIAGRQGPPQRQAPQEAGGAINVKNEINITLAKGTPREEALEFGRILEGERLKGTII